jgi:ligand-binding SRPBCC domain-containing protein
MSPNRVQRELIITAPRDEVFRVISDPTLTPEWLIGVQSVKVLTPGAIAVGSETISKVEALGRTWDARGRCVAYDSPHRITIETILGPGMWSRSDSQVEACDHGTRLIAELAYQLPGGPLGALVGAAGAHSVIERDFDQSLQRLKLMIEAQENFRTG